MLILGVLIGSCFLLTALIKPGPARASYRTHVVPEGPASVLAPSHSTAVDSSIAWFQKEAPLFANSCAALRATLQSLNTQSPRSIAQARQQLIDCRLHYKRIEFFLEYFFRSSSRIYNGPPKYEPEEPDMEYQSPVGLQVIETLLYDSAGLTTAPEAAKQKDELVRQIGAVTSSAADLPSLLYGFQADDRQLLESLRVELVRIISLGITGYDAPSLKSGLAESAEALQSMRFQLQSYRPRDSLFFFLDKALAQLRNHPEFDSFDRLAFLTEAALPLQRQIGLFIRERKLELNTTGILNYQADNLFSPNALLAENFPREATNNEGARPGGSTDLREAGEQLFFDKRLSGNGQRSCASCHNPEKMFTDQLPANATFDRHGSLTRNTPTLLYAGFQYRQFWDGKVNTLEEQVRTVLRDSLEMNGATRSDQETAHITAAIAAYVRSLHPFNSPFDHYMQGDNKALNNRQKNGANLFMGKAQCATCHFIPIFNGLIPPDYKLTEFEALGTTLTDAFDKPTLSPDEGRYTLYPFDFYRRAFKTPTVRNTAATYPYMHNGAFHSLEKVMEFYNRGGGAGLGLNVPEQTLPPTPLHLTDREMQDIILFLQALTDSTGHKS
ncbi:MAG TPA: cytochrome c peroxidase [Puia sp.]|nr:cytochrome c peroxidase [Puia sp.]